MKHGDRDRFDVLVDSLHEQRPEVEANDAHYSIQWRINNRLVAVAAQPSPLS